MPGGLGVPNAPAPAPLDVLTTFLLLLQLLSLLLQTAMEGLQQPSSLAWMTQS